MGGVFLCVAPLTEPAVRDGYKLLFFLFFPFFLFFSGMFCANLQIRLSTSFNSFSTKKEHTYKSIICRKLRQIHIGCSFLSNFQLKNFSKSGILAKVVFNKGAGGCSPSLRRQERLRFGGHPPLINSL